MMFVLPRLFSTGVDLKMGNFSCWSPYCLAFNKGQFITNLRSHRAAMVKNEVFESRLISKLLKYKRTVSRSEKFKDFIIWLHKQTGVTPSKTGTPPRATIAAATRWFIDPKKPKEWSLLAQYPPITGANPFDVWVTELHEKHHKETILKSPGIKAAYVLIENSRRSLLANRNMMLPYNFRLLMQEVKDIPGFIVDEQSVIAQQKSGLDQQIRTLGGARLRVIGLRQLIRKRSGPNWRLIKMLAQQSRKLSRLSSAYYFQSRYVLLPRLAAEYKKFETWADNARNAAGEDLQAYCVSWRATKQAIQFIDLCCPSAAGRRRTRRGAYRRRRGGGR